MDETDNREIRAELCLVSRSHEQHDDTGDEEHQQERADQLGEICRKSSFLHAFSSYNPVGSTSGGSLPILREGIGFPAR